MQAYMQVLKALGSEGAVKALFFIWGQNAAGEICSLGGETKVIPVLCIEVLAFSVYK